MLSSLNWASFPKLGFAVIFFASTLISARVLPAQEQYPAVARLSFISGPVTYSRGDDPDEWDDAIENVPLTIGDRIYAPENGRAELQLSSGNFVRLAPRSYFSTLNLSDDIKQFYLGDGAASFNIRRLRSDEVIEIDTPNVSVTLEEPGRYRVAVDEDGNSRITVRRGRVMVAASGRQIPVENSEIRVFGIDSPRYEIVALPSTDAFDRWVSERDDRFERSYAQSYRHTSEDIIGVEDLAEYGRWEEIPEYGYAWTPSRVAAGWAPFNDGRWYWQDPWGWSWISNDRWGYATSHYGRWTPHRSRWYWVPARPRTRVRYAPAVVEFVRVRDHVGWFPLHPRDRHIPWWERRDRQRNQQHITYVNRTYVTVINHNHFVSARPVHRHIVRDSVIVQEARSARFTPDSLPIPSRSSLRVVSETGARRGHRPSDNVLNRTAVVRTAPPAPPPSFQEKLPHIQKSQGRPIEPSAAFALASQDDRAKARRVRIRPAAEQSRAGDFAPRNPGANTGPIPQPLTEARGKKLATRENSGDSNAAERTERAQKTPAPQQPSQPEPSKGTASRQESPRLEQDRDRQREEKQTLERERRAEQQKQQELERRQKAEQKQEERKAEVQKQQQDQTRREQQKQQKAQEHQAREQQKQQEPERKQQQAQQREEERKAQLQRQQQDQRRQELRQQELQERQGRDQQKQQELERRQQQQQEQERKAQLQQNRQEQERREQLRQQQLQERQSQQQRQQEQERAQQLRQQQSQERQAREQRRQQELERSQQQQQREQERNAQLQQRQQDQIRREQLRQQQLQERQVQQQQELERRQQGQQREQEREAQLQQRQQEQARRQQLRQQQLQERQAQQLQKLPGQ